MAADILNMYSLSNSLYAVAAKRTNIDPLHGHPSCAMMYWPS